MTKMRGFIGIILLLLTALIWGVAFVAQDVGMDSIGPFTFGGTRTLIGAAALLPFILIRDGIQRKNLDKTEKKKCAEKDRNTYKYGIVVGLVFFAATTSQQFAFQYSDAGKIAFITALYMFFVPLFGLFFRKKVPLVTWICVVFGFVGLYFLCSKGVGFSGFGKGDLLSLLCSMLFACHILVIERFSDKVDGVKLSFVQLFVSGVISSVLMLIFEKPSIDSILAAAIPILYAGVMSSGVAYTLQIVGQKYTEATIASLVLCLESVFGALSASVILGQRMTEREVAGCIIMFVAIVVSQFSDKITAALKKEK